MCLIAGGFGVSPLAARYRGVGARAAPRCGKPSSENAATPPGDRSPWSSRAGARKFPTCVVEPSPERIASDLPLPAPTGGPPGEITAAPPGDRPRRHCRRPGLDPFEPSLAPLEPPSQRHPSRSHSTHLLPNHCRRHPSPRRSPYADDGLTRRRCRWSSWARRRSRRRRPCLPQGFPNWFLRPLPVPDRLPFRRSPIQIDPAGGWPRRAALVPTVPALEASERSWRRWIFHWSPGNRGWERRPLSANRYSAYSV